MKHCDMARAPKGNRLLQALSKPDLALLTPSLEAVAFPLRQVFETPNKRIENICFPVIGIASVVAEQPGKGQDRDRHCRLRIAIAALKWARPKDGQPRS